LKALLEKAIGLVKDKELDFLKGKVCFVQMMHKPARRCNDNIRIRG